jgi:hypothetical protein
MPLLNGLAAILDFLGSTGLVRLLIIGAVLFGLWLGLARAGFPRPQRVRTWLLVAVPLVAWFALVWLLATAGALQARPGAPPLLPVAIFAPVLLGLVLLTRSSRIAAALDAIPPAWLVGLQVYRIFGGAFLVQFALGKLSAVFALPAGTGDVMVGLLALPVAFYLNHNPAGGRAAAVAWNLFGVLDLVLAITLGFLSSTGRLQGLGVAPAPLSYPLVMVPAFAVPLSVILHGMSLWQLKRRARGQAAPRDVAATAIARSTA